MPFSLKLLLIGLHCLLTGIVVISLAPFDRDGRVANRVISFWTWAVLKVGGIRVKVQGLERLDPKGHYIFIANHQSYIDIPTLVQALPPFQLRWIAKKELLWVPLFGWALWSAKHIIVDRSNLSKVTSSLRKAEQRIRAGASVVIFPEGTRSSGGELRPFKRGGFVLAIKTQTPIVPVTIGGSGTILPRGDWRIRKGEIEVFVSEPVRVDQYRAGNVKSLLTRVRDEVESHSRRHVQHDGNRLSEVQAMVSVSGPVWE